jgi:hypothetical protein
MSPTRFGFALTLLLVVAPAAQGTAPAPATPPRATPVGSAHKRAHASAVTPARSAADTSARARARLAPRTLDDIHIEGEIPVPQVLFITARDQRRFMEFQHHRYLKSSLELGRATATPSRIVVTAPAPVERKEIQR